MSAKTRNEQRKLIVGVLDGIARIVLAAGLVKPIFSPGPDDVSTLLGAVVASIVLWDGVTYFIVGMEDER